MIFAKVVRLLGGEVKGYMKQAKLVVILSKIVIFEGGGRDNIHVI